METTAQESLKNLNSVGKAFHPELFPLPILSSILRGHHRSIPALALSCARGYVSETDR